MTLTERQIVDGLLGAYLQGAFPMGDPETGRVDWYAPDPRALMPLSPESARGAGDGFHVSRSLARTLRSDPYEVTADTSFEAVMRACAEPRRDGDGTWIDERIVRWYTALHRHGHAHCLEAWTRVGERRMVGGIYGVSIGGAFFAESMYSRPLEGGANASKVCVAYLVAHLRRRGYALLDVQLRNDHIDQFGVIEVTRSRYMEMLGTAAALPVTWGVFDQTLGW